MKTALKALILLIFFSEVFMLPARSCAAARVDLRGIDAPLDQMGSGENQSFRAVTATVSNAESPASAMAAILDHLSEEQLQNTVVTSEDPEVLNTLMKRPHVRNAGPSTPGIAFFPLGNLANDRNAYRRVKDASIARGWQAARALNSALKDSSLFRGGTERTRFLSDPANRIDAIYFTVITGLVTRGWLYVRGSHITPAHFNVTLGTVSNLVFFQGLRLFYSIIPNKFAATTAFTTDQLRKVFGQDRSVPPTELWKLAGNATTQAVINAASSALNSLNPGERFLSAASVIPIFLNTVTGTITDVFIQQAYLKFDQLKYANGSELMMTDLFLRRLGMVSGLLASYYAPTSELQQGRVRAWIAQGIEVALWAYVAWDFPRVSSKAETGKIMKGYFSFERFLTQTTPQYLKEKFHAPSCHSFFAD